MRPIAIVVFLAAVILFAFVLPMKANEFSRECRSRGGEPVRGYDGLICAALNTVGETPR